jgi:hypothetical protein
MNQDSRSSLANQASHPLSCVRWSTMPQLSHFPNSHGRLFITMYQCPTVSPRCTEDIVVLPILGAHSSCSSVSCLRSSSKWLRSSKLPVQGLPCNALFTQNFSPQAQRHNELGSECGTQQRYLDSASSGVANVQFSTSSSSPSQTICSSTYKNGSSCGSRILVHV